MHGVLFWPPREASGKATQDFCTLLTPSPSKQHSHAHPASYACYSSVAPGTLNNYYIIAKKAYSQVDKIITVFI